MAKRQSLVWQLPTLFVLASCSSNGTPPAASSDTLHFVNGSHYTYRNVAYGVVTAAKGTPSPIPTSTSNDSIVVTTPASFDGGGGLVKVVYQRKIATRRGTQTLTSNDYYGVRSVAGGTFLERVGSDGPGFTLKYTSPELLLEEPFHAGNHWMPSGAYQLRSNTRNETWNSDGSYESNYIVQVRIGSAPPTTEHVRTVVNSDGSATLFSRVGSCVPVILRIGVPVSANGKYRIPYAESQSPTCHGRPIVTKRLGVDWYPGGAQAPSPLETSSVADEGSGAIPASCNVPQSVATAGEKIVRTQTVIDPFGTISQSTDTRYYAQPLGLVCNLRSGTVRDFGIGLGRGLLLTLRTNGVRSMQTSSAAAGAALPIADAGNASLFIGVATECLVPQPVARNMKATCNNTPALSRWSRTDSPRIGSLP